MTSIDSSRRVCKLETQRRQTARAFGRRTASQRFTAQSAFSGRLGPVSSAPGLVAVVGCVSHGQTMGRRHSEITRMVNQGLGVCPGTDTQQTDVRPGVGAGLQSSQRPSKHESPFPPAPADWSSGTRHGAPGPFFTRLLGASEELDSRDHSPGGGWAAAEAGPRTSTPAEGKVQREGAQQFGWGPRGKGCSR